MAANLNKPADFLGKTYNPLEACSPILLPPSEFEKPKKAQQAKVNKLEEKENDLILKLTQENERLKQIQSHVQFEPYTASHNEYADELIKRQAEEIVELKNEILKFRQSYNQELVEWERKIELLEDRHNKEVKVLEKQLERQEDDFELRYSRLSSELQRTVEEANIETASLRETLEKNKSILTNRNRELEDALRESEKTVTQQENELRNKSRIIEDQLHQIAKFKTYIGQSESTNKPAQVWKVEKETVDNKLKLAQAENQKLQSELELLEVRFKALSDILSIQEGELSKAKSEGLNPNKQHNVLLTRWREKVFMLIVQQKSGEIAHKNDINKLKQIILNLEENLKSCDANCEVLKLSLMDKSAQLQMETNNRERLQTELDQLTKVTMSFDDESKENYNSMRTLMDFIEKYRQKNDEKLIVLEDKSKQLKTLCQRVYFASSRMELLKTQLFRKAAIDTSMNKDSAIPLVPIMMHNSIEETTPGHTGDHLEQELERVIKERDILASQVKEDSTRWSERLVEIKNEYMMEVASLKNTIEELELGLQNKSKECAMLTEELECLKEDLTLKNETLQQKQSDLLRYEKGIESVLADQRLKDEEIWQTKLAEIDQKLNDSKREHAKTVVSLRQLERKHARDIARNQELLQTTEDHLKRQLDNVESELTKVEKERNLMMAILKQEGLIHDMKTERGEPIQFDVRHVSAFEQPEPKDKNYQSRTEQHFVAESRGEVALDNSLPTQTHSREDVQDVLEDLKSLTADIFNDNETDEELEQL